jgi:hypothetical protein
LLNKLGAILDETSLPNGPFLSDVNQFGWFVGEGVRAG